MKLELERTSLPIFLSSTTAALFLSIVASCGRQADAHVSAVPQASAPATETARSAADKPLRPAQLALLDLAFSAASALPAQPHLKNRARLQESVIAACFELDQPQRALGYIEKVDNWRRAAGYADYAFYCAEHGCTKDVQHYLDLALKNSPIVEDDSTQDWQRDRIKATIAKTHLILGQKELASRFENGIVDSERGMLTEVRAKQMTPEGFDHEMQTIDSVIATNNFDQVRTSLANCTRWFDRFYTDEVRRTIAEQKIKTSWGKLPIVVRIELLKELSRFAIEHADPKKARELLDETQALVDGAKWIADDRVPLMSSLAVLRHRAGETEKARAELTAALALFDADHDKIVNIYRAGILRPVAEAYQSIGDTQTALKLYKRVVEEGIANPNSRPRAEALSATCASLALHEVELDGELQSRLQQVRDGLSAPW